MDAKIENGELIIRMATEANPRPSKSGKTLLVASSGGFQNTNAEHDGKPVRVMVKATTPKG